VEFLSVGSEYFINSQELENKVRSLLPSQGGAGAGFDLSASTQIIPIIDLTESAEGSNVREDLQTSLSFKNSTNTSVTNATSTIITNTGYFRIFGNIDLVGAGYGAINVTDGATTKILLKYFGSASQISSPNFDFILFLAAGDSCSIESSSTGVVLSATTRQIANIDGNLVNP
jgi:hypothetical protein